MGKDEAVLGWHGAERQSREQDQGRSEWQERRTWTYKWVASDKWNKLSLPTRPWLTSMKGAHREAELRSAYGGWIQPGCLWAFWGVAPAPGAHAGLCRCMVSWWTCIEMQNMGLGASLLWSSGWVAECAVEPESQPAVWLYNCLSTSWAYLGTYWPLWNAQFYWQNEINNGTG